MAASTTTSWDQKIAAKRQAGRDKIPKEWLLPSSILEGLQMPLDKHPNRVNDLDIPRKSGILTAKELDITENYTVESLLAKLRNGELSALDVTVAFSKRAAIAQQLVCFLPFHSFAE